MNRRLLRVVGALFALAAGLAVLTVTAAGLCCLLVAMTLTAPLSQGRVVAATIAAAGLVLLAAAHGIDRHALRRGLDRAATICSQLVTTVGTAGRI